MSSSYPPTQSILVFNKNNFSNSAPPIRTIEKTEQVEVEVPKSTRLSGSHTFAHVKGGQDTVINFDTILIEMEYKDQVFGPNCIGYLSFGVSECFFLLTSENKQLAVGSSKRLRIKVLDQIRTAGNKNFGYINQWGSRPNFDGNSLDCTVSKESDSGDYTFYWEIDIYENHRQQ